MPLLQAPSGFTDATRFTAPAEAFDVCVIGSGAGGAVTAATLAAAGLSVVILEEGGHYTKADFKMREDLAFPQLYQESGSRTTKDLGISILQGRAVGGTTVVNWTTSFRTPEDVVAHWKKVHGVGGFSYSDLVPHWEAVEERLNIKQIGLEETNRNNRTLYDGMKALGWEVSTTRRNTRQCMKSGYCGLGCPVDAKQSMLITYLPDAVAKGAVVVSRCRVDRLRLEAGKIAAAECSEIGPDGYNVTGRTLEVRARRFVVSAGAINSPAILIRSGLGGGAVGRRTFLHPVVGTAAIFKDPIEPFYGAPQSVASHHFAHRGDDVGLFLEAAPLQPMMAAIAATGFGETHRKNIEQLARMSAHIALAIDGFHPSESGGTVEVRPSGAPILDYPIPPRIRAAHREALKILAKIDLAAGAQAVYTPHDPPIEIRSEKDIAQLDHAKMGLHEVNTFSAHVMGGCAMGDDPKTSVVRSSDLRHHTVENLHVVDGSVFPTSLGVNPQESIYGLARLMATRFVAEWKRA
jgi:choline dehydrogenase-like flavoprotein